MGSRRKARKIVRRGSDLVAKQTEQISVRISPTLLSFLEKWGKAQVPEMKERAVARFAIEVFKAIADQLDTPDWHEVNRLAADAGKDVGSFIGATMKAMVETARKAKK